MLNRFFPATPRDSILQQLLSAIEHIKATGNTATTGVARVPASQVLALLKVAPRPISAEALAKFGNLRTGQVQSGLSYLSRTGVITKVGKNTSTQRRCTIALYDFI